MDPSLLGGEFESKYIVDALGFPNIGGVLDPLIIGGLLDPSVIGGVLAGLADVSPSSGSITLM